MLCKDCHYFVPIMAPGSKTVREGNCHLEPPKAFPAPTGKGGVAVISVRPSVKSGEIGCEGFEERETPITEPASIIGLINKSEKPAE